jgi:hypothetical protein
MAVDSVNAPTSSTLYDYSTDLMANVGGRYLSGSTGTSGVAEWRSQFLQTGSATNNGTAALTIFARTASGATSSQSLSIALDLVASDGTTLISSFGTGTLTPSSPWNCAGFQQISGTIAIANGKITIAKNSILRLRVTGGSTAMLLAFGASAYDAYLDVPYTSGTGT